MSTISPLKGVVRLSPIFRKLVLPSSHLIPISENLHNINAIPTTAVLSSNCSRTWLQFKSNHSQRELTLGLNRNTVNMIRGTGACLRPSKQQASLRARDLARSCELVGVGHRFGKGSVLAIMPSQFMPRSLSGHRMPLD